MAGYEEIKARNYFHFINYTLSKSNLDFNSRSFEGYIQVMLLINWKQSRSCNGFEVKKTIQIITNKLIEEYLWIFHPNYNSVIRKECYDLLDLHLIIDFIKMICSYIYIYIYILSYLTFFLLFFKLKNHFPKKKYQHI
jgi:hypothetical protein